MKEKKAILLLFLGVFCSLIAYNQDTLSAVDKMQCLYAVYYEGYKKGEFEPFLLEKAESICFQILEEDSSNFVANYYLGLMYGNEIVRLQEREDFLRKQYDIYRKRANRMIEESKEKPEQE
ncbi:hypothetical protein G3O08_11600 [Cryomorpha ignava]|uniref:DUF4296 domain-containing protein n=1 Tax=Cryomorpha ignava TaxID=101383 RepID=A0A7K3WRJ9_9FLAO|nr:hypothetical protein [Cryomorpha ignava]NEN24146.1 hypothetical protein [Cryomorpha ignava]